MVDQLTTPNFVMMRENCYQSQMIFFLIVQKPHWYDTCLKAQRSQLEGEHMEEKQGAESF